MKNVFLIGNGFDLHHKLPTKYFDFMCVAEYLICRTLIKPLKVGDVFSKCVKSEHIQECYNKFKKEKGLEFVALSDIEKLKDKINPQQIAEYYPERQREMVIV